MLCRSTKASLTLALAAALLCSGLLVPSTAGAQQSYPDYGTADIRDQRLRPGCHTYRVRYRLSPPEDQWSAIIQFFTPKNRKMGTILLDANRPDPLRGSRPFRICGATVKQGRFTAQVTMITRVGRDDQQEVKARPTHFRLERRRR